MQRVSSIDKGGIGEELGVAIGDMLLEINGQPVLDVVDYQYLVVAERLALSFLRQDGKPYEALVEKELYEPLGLGFASGLMSEVRSCKNHCVFCFIDQMPKGGRKTLAFKDDDWRLSFIMGNYVTLTNVPEEEFKRILDRRVSPLYISVHATDPAIRVEMMRNKQAGQLMERLRALKENTLRFHCQIVCCPGLNDEKVLDKTLKDLYALYPEAQSVAVVPVGLTKHREGLYPLRGFTKKEAEALLLQIEAFAASCKASCGSRFVFAADELYLLAERALPPYEAYEAFAQIENGVGLLRLFEYEFLEALQLKTPLPEKRQVDIAGGMLAHPFFKALYIRLLPYGVEAVLHPVRNDFFGDTVTVGGLLTGQDIAAQLKGALKTNTLYIPHNMLREREDVFLDGMRVAQLEQALQARVIPVYGEGEAWVEALLAPGEKGGSI